MSIAQYLLLMYVDLSDLQIWNWIVQIACMYILTAHNHQTAGLTVGNFLPAFFDFAYITLLAFATCDKLQLATCFIPPHYSYLGIRIVLIHLVYFIWKKITNNSTWPVVWVTSLFILFKKPTKQWCLTAFKQYIFFSRTMDRLFHGSYYKNAYGTTKLILPGKNACWAQTDAFGNILMT